MPITHRHDEMHRGLVPIDQLGTGGDGSGDNVLHDDQTWGPAAGGASVPVDHGAMGATETIDLADGDWHRGTLDADCTITVQGFTLDEGVVLLAEIDQDGTGGWAITWDADVDFGGADDQPDQTPSSRTTFMLWSSEGDGTIYGAKVGAGGVTGGTPALTFGTTNAAGTAATAVLTDATLAIFDATVPTTAAFGDSAATGSAAFAARRDHRHGMPTAPSGGGGPLLISDDHSTPIVFGDLLLTEDGDDFLYADGWE